MNKKFIYWLLIALPLFVCTNCEYDLEETNYVEIEKPLEPNYKVEIKAPVNEQGEYIIKYPLVKFDFELPENIRELRFYLYRENDNYSYDSFSASMTSPYISLNWTNPGKYTLKCEIPPSRTNTGSLADISGYEHYGKTFEWKIILQQNPAPSLNLQYERLSETTFKLFWDKPDTDYGEVDYYEIINGWSGSLLGTITDTSCVVTLPQWDNGIYIIRANFKESYLSPLESYVSISNYNH